MATLSTLIVKLTGDSSGLAAELAEAERKAKTTAGNIQDIGNRISGVGLGLTAAVSAPILMGAEKAIDAASDLSESASKVQVVFGDSAGVITKFSEDSATAMGISQQKALEAAGTFGNFFVSMNMGQGQAADMSTNLVKLAADLASFNNLDPTEALDKLRAGMAGETEPLRALGVNLNAASVSAKAVSMGIVKASVDMAKVNEAQFKYDEATRKSIEATEKYGISSNEAKAAAIAQGKAETALNDALEGKIPDLTAAQKAQAAYALIMEQTKTAQGDFARTSTGLANSQRIQNALFANTASTLGNNLLPYKIQLVQKINDLIGAFQRLSPDTQGFIIKALLIAAAVGPVLLIVGQLITAFGTIAGVFAGVGIAAGPLLLIIGLVAGAAFLLYQAWTNNWGGIQEKTQRIIDYVVSIVNLGLELVTGFIDRHSAEAKQLFSWAWEQIGQTVGELVGSIAQWIGDKLRDIARWIAEHKQIITLIFDGAWNVIAGIFRLGVAVITGVIRLFIALFKGDIGGMWEALKSIFRNGLQALSQILGGIVEMGAGIVTSLISGIWSQADSFAASLRDFVNKAIGDVAGFLGIKLKAEAETSARATGATANRATSSFTPSAYTPNVSFSGAGALAGAGGPSVTINATVSNDLDIERLANRVAKTIKRG